MTFMNWNELSEISIARPISIHSDGAEFRLHLPTESSPCDEID